MRRCHFYFPSILNSHQDHPSPNETKREIRLRLGQCVDGKYSSDEATTGSRQIESGIYLNHLALVHPVLYFRPVVDLLPVVKHEPPCVGLYKDAGGRDHRVPLGRHDHIDLTIEK